MQPKTTVTVSAKKQKGKFDTEKGELQHKMTAKQVCDETTSMIVLLRYYDSTITVL